MFRLARRVAVCALVLCAWSVRAAGACPSACECSEAAQTVKCVSRELREVPRGIPGYARNLFILGNRIRRLAPGAFSGLENVTNLSLSNNRIVEVESHSFGALRSLRSLDLSGNQLALIHPEALAVPGSPLRELNLSRALYNRSAAADLATALRWGALSGLQALDLSANRLLFLPAAMFAPLPALRRLTLANNSLLALPNGSFLGLEALEDLDLSLNGFRAFRREALRELDRLGRARLRLAHNPLACVCGLEEFCAWLNASLGRVQDGERLACSSPPELRNASLSALGGRALGCHGDGAGQGAGLALQTSYVLLGLVLGLVGVLFLFVLYLNRHGIKKWALETREACREVLEGYHYRYEIDSDPRLGQICTSGDL
ncbi:hypothetical protein AAFF_G00267320 [Aldrovandia affinis]|uniref:Trophoblast glycoprotein-like n=1 Tax=Aldrovandia affinis TaxID=143900 RepID=A0AAD7RBD7_9TELE|nr:hypothetical protein AAFF_G00267320 [Aldrovandia affinis]